MRTEIRFRAMGTIVHVATAGLHEHRLDRAKAIVETCEQRWSRFRPDSELSRLNASAGTWTTVTPETYALIDAAIAGWRMTAGRFDPTVLHALMAAGYDRSFELVAATAAAAGTTGLARPGAANQSGAGCGDIELDPDAGAVRLPAGVGLDVGGIAKGHTADLVVDELIRVGASGALANVGGDVRVAGRAPTGRAWRVAVEDPAGQDDPIAVCSIGDGAIATTSRHRRQWTTANGPAHHVIDPATGQPAAGDLLAVSVVACRAVWAEVLAKAAFIGGRQLAMEILADAGATGILVERAGTIVQLPGLGAFLR